MFAFRLQVGVQQRFIAFTTAPQNVVLPAEFVRGIHVRLHRCGGIGVNIGIGVRGSA